MFILSVVKPKDEFLTRITSAFPDITFVYRRKMEEAVDDLPCVEVLVTFGDDLTPELIGKATNLKWIMVLSAGIDKMPFQAIKEKGILVTNVRGIHKIPMAEYTLGMMLQVSRQNKKLIELEKEQKWDQRAVRPYELNGKALLVLGVGAIGGEVARLAKAFQMRVIGINRSGTKHGTIDEVYSLNEMEMALERADFIVSVLPSTEETRYILKEKHFDVMKRKPVFINIGRGDIVAEEVLIKAIEEEKISHAVLDVFEQEPLPKDHPFWSMEQVTVTPHISSITKNYLPRALEIFEHNLRIYKQGGNSYLNVINVDRGY